ncbi:MULTISPECIES: adenylyltransferase/cytidyltransferase family protein [Pantoea]|jgi:glycerol-3-phosphate cytidylyltransferase|uniref:adenylyltransferase/cytidyltransferase family protein n=1 Tax=Pantoea TaxID=53335 RepID=UPI0024130B23|nr:MULTISPECIES: adenylyltransferase/cytidyltransferase family protein [Pantoea]MDR6352657.1 glycerol-3-phosphate cytidylyltransferase [Pantoea sp. SORGH_AS_0659]WFL69896.1 adenylyltransferase/cytidyltransferase family protein [Pantoea sp. X85]
MKKIITFGTFDVFHVGHLHILQRAKTLGDWLTVGVSSDALNFHKKGRNPVYDESDRMSIIAGIKYVDEVFLEESLELKADYIKKYNANTLVMGDDWKGKFDKFSSLAEVIYLERTPSISTTSLIEIIKKR